MVFQELFGKKHQQVHTPLTRSQGHFIHPSTPRTYLHTSPQPAESINVQQSPYYSDIVVCVHTCTVHFLARQKKPDSIRGGRSRRFFFFFVIYFFSQLPSSVIVTSRASDDLPVCAKAVVSLPVSLGDISLPTHFLSKNTGESILTLTQYYLPNRIGGLSCLILAAC